MTGWSYCFGPVIRQHHSRNVSQRNRGSLISFWDVFSIGEVLGLSHNKEEKRREREGQGGEREERKKRKARWGEEEGRKGKVGV